MRVYSKTLLGNLETLCYRKSASGLCDNPCCCMSAACVNEVFFLQKTKEKATCNLLSPYPSKDVFVQVESLMYHVSIVVSGSEFPCEMYIK
jgi:hypothetical protein